MITDAIVFYWAGKTELTGGAEATINGHRKPPRGRLGLVDGSMDDFAGTIISSDKRIYSSPGNFAQETRMAREGVTKDGSDKVDTLNESR